MLCGATSVRVSELAPKLPQLVQKLQKLRLAFSLARRPLRPEEVGKEKVDAHPPPPSHPMIACVQRLQTVQALLAVQQLLEERMERRWPLQLRLVPRAWRAPHEEPLEHHPRAEVRPHRLAQVRRREQEREKIHDALELPQQVHGKLRVALAKLRDKLILP